MAIALKNLLLLAEGNNSITVNHLDGTTSTLPFFQRSFDYPENGTPLILKDLPGVNEETNGKLDLVNQVTGNFVRGGAITLAKSAVDDVIRLGKVLISPKGLAWSTAQLALAATNPKNSISPRNRQSNLFGLMTVATAGSGAAGLRFRKDGLVDIKVESGFNYDSTRGGKKYESSLRELINKGTDEISDHTMYGIYNKVNIFDVGGTNIKKYSGGPHSLFGIGNTEIKKYKADPFRGYLPLFNQDLFSLRQAHLTPSSKHKDYRSVNPAIFPSLPIEDSKTRINLYKLGDPGLDLSGDDIDVYDTRTIDKISAASIFKRQNLLDEGEFKDYIKFRIAVVDSENPLNDNMILFRALLDNVADNFSGEWNSFKYNGRAEKFYTYGGFDRSIDFGFKIHTQTRWEQKPLWRKLNYLVAQTAPEYKNRRMRGVFSRLTIGDWINEIPGFFTSVNLSWSTAYPWEIRQDSEGADKDLNEYPHILDVSCNFKPIHNFAPSNSPTTPFILPEIGVNEGQKYAQISDDESVDDFNKNGIATDAGFADIDTTSTTQPLPVVELETIATPLPIPNNILPLESRGLML